MERRERPRCRQWVEARLKEGYTLEDLARDRFFYTGKDGHRVFFSDGLRKQIRKMIEENEGIILNWKTFYQIGHFGGIKATSV